VGLRVTGELADLWSINATGEANTLPEEGDKVLAQRFSVTPLPAALYAGVLAGVTWRSAPELQLQPAYSPKRKKAISQNFILVLCFFFSVYY